MGCVRCVVWGRMLYADDACTVSRSPRGLATMVEVIAEVCRALRPNRVHRGLRCESKRPGKPYKQVHSFTYLEGAVIETLDTSTEIARRTDSMLDAYQVIPTYELYDQPNAALSLKTRITKALANEALRCGCSTWTLKRPEYYSKLRTVYHRVLLSHHIGAQRKRQGHRG